MTYHPTEVGKEILHKNLLCFIQGGSPLSLTLSGVCVGPPSVKEVSRCYQQMDQWWNGPASPTRELSQTLFKQSSVPTSNMQTCSLLHRASARALPTADILLFPSPFS